jgi:putrescine transport system permease protein
MSKGGFSRWFDRKGWVGLVIGLPYVWLVALFLLPFLIVLAMSVATNTPTAPPFSFGGEHPWINLGAYERIATDGLYVRAFLTSIFNAFVSAMLCLLIGYPMALGLTRVSKSWRNILLMLVILPFWTSFLLARLCLDGADGQEQLVQRASDRCLELPGADGLGGELDSDDELEFRRRAGDGLYLPAVHDPAALCQSRTAGPHAGRSGDGSWLAPEQVFRDVTLPQSVPGIIAGGLLVFIPAAGELVIPTLVGNASHADDRPASSRTNSPRRATGRWLRRWRWRCSGADGGADDGLQPLSSQGRRGRNEAPFDLS